MSLLWDHQKVSELANCMKSHLTFFLDDLYLTTHSKTCRKCPYISAVVSLRDESYTTFRRLSRKRAEQREDVDQHRKISCMLPGCSIRRCFWKRNLNLLRPRPCHCYKKCFTAWLRYAPLYTVLCITSMIQLAAIFVLGRFDWIFTFIAIGSWICQPDTSEYFPNLSHPVSLCNFCFGS